MFLQLALTLLLVYYLSRQWRKTTQLPPGPYPILFFGNLPHLWYYGWKYGGIVPAMRHLKKVSAISIACVLAMPDASNPHPQRLASSTFTDKYGPVFTIWLGPLPSVRIAEYALSHEAMVRYGANYQDRFSPAPMLVGRGDRGLIVSNGDIWREQRRFSLHVLRDLGVSRNLMEEKIMDEFNWRFGELEKQKFGATVDPSLLFDRLSGGIINRLLFSAQFSKSEEEKFFALKKRLDVLTEGIQLVDIVAKDWMMKVPIMKKRWERLLSPTHEVKEAIRRQLAERKRAIDEGSHVLDNEPRDYTDAFLMKMKDEQKNGMNGTTFDDETLAVNVLDLWVAGQETTASTLTWAMIYLLRNPQVTHAVREELLRVTSGSRPLSLKDKPETPYFVATVTEIQRLASILNMNIWRLTKEDTEIGGYSVPKNTVVTAELSLILSDETVFKNPKEFDPSRFISEPALLPKVVPFGLGRRACLGEPLARAELYLVSFANGLFVWQFFLSNLTIQRYHYFKKILGNLLLRYSIQSVGAPPPDKQLNTYGVLKKPKHFKMIFTKIA